MMLLRKAASPNSSWGEVVGEAGSTPPGLASKMAQQCRRWGMGWGKLRESGMSSHFRFSQIQASEWVTYFTMKLFKWAAVGRGGGVEGCGQFEEN